MRENKPNLSEKFENPNIKHLLERLLNSDPTKRPTAKEVLEQAWLLSIVGDRDGDTPHRGTNYETDFFGLEFDVDFDL